VGAVRAVEERGLVVGRDVAVTGFDAMPVILYLRPGITTLRQPPGKWGSA
jgi:LacI family transcriptional regulator